MNTPRRTLRVPAGLWAAAVSKAALEGTTVTAVTIEALTEFVNTPLQDR